MSSLNYLRFYFAALAILILDQFSKIWVSQSSGISLGSYWPNGGVEIIPQFFYLAYVGNSGAAWGMLTGFSSGLIVIALLALASIYLFRRQIGLGNPPFQWPLGMLCGGIAGNLLDRIAHGYVIDFLDFRIFGYLWPAFNIADSGITIGVLTYLLISLYQQPSYPDAESGHPPNSESY